MDKDICNGKKATQNTWIYKFSNIQKTNFVVKHKQHT